jgi:hypothetical protein
MKCPNCGADMLAYNLKKHGRCYSCHMNKLITQCRGGK